MKVCEVCGKIRYVHKVKIMGSKYLVCAECTRDDNLHIEREFSDGTIKYYNLKGEEICGKQ